LVEGYARIKDKDAQPTFGQKHRREASGGTASNDYCILITRPSKGLQVGVFYNRRQGRSGQHQGIYPLRHRLGLGKLQGKPPRLNPPNEGMALLQEPCIFGTIEIGSPKYPPRATGTLPIMARKAGIAPTICEHRFMTNSPSGPLRSILPLGSNPIGFGCGGLLCGMDQVASLRLLETAIDCGITYFDTARMYGFGNAEAVLGRALLHRRDRFIIASKAGIFPASRSIPLRALNRGIKFLHNIAPPLASQVPTLRAIHPRFGQLRVPDIRKSLEQSLKKLRTDYLDIFLLHECTEVDVDNAELRYFLQELQKEGKIRAFGIATGITETIHIMKAHPNLTSIVQIPNSIWNMNMQRLPCPIKGGVVTHSILTHRFHDLAKQLSSNISLAKKWKSAIHIDPIDKAALARVLMAHALHTNPDGVVLFFSTKSENICAIANVATSVSRDVAVMEAMTDLAVTTAITVK
jgi:diketogulonate reductase-like aldo/keto reductase